MLEGKPSGTAYRVALRRAAHQVFDQPVVFADPLALQIIGAHRKDSRAAQDLRAPSRPSSVSLRAFLVARSQFAEETLAVAVKQNAVTQYVLLGAGLDTFAYRNPHAGLRVFEVDHPDTQAWKLHLLARTSSTIPAGTVHVAVDFHHDSLADQLATAGFDRTAPAVFAWLGVVPYLTDEAFTATMRYLSSCAAGSVLIMDYGLPRHALPTEDEQRAFDSLAERVAQSGEPFQLFFMPAELHARMNAMGWQTMEDLDRDAINTRYFRNRTDNLRCLSNGGHLFAARLTSEQRQP